MTFKLPATLRLTILVLGLLLWLIPASHALAGQEDANPVPPPPPTWEDADVMDSALAPDSERGSGAGAPQPTNFISDCTTRRCVFIPSVVVPRPDPRAQALSIYNRLYLPSQGAQSGWSGNVGACQPGATSAAFLDAMKMRINYFREMAGVPAITTLNSGYNATDQSAALMMSANKALSHNPPANWACYTSQGAAGAGKSNLFLGYFGPTAIDGYIRDPGDGNQAAGHRRWILHPPTVTMGSGDIPGGSGVYASNALYVLDNSIWNSRPATSYGFVAWPPPGYVPYNTVYPRWSFALPNANFTGSTVTVTSNSGPVSVTRFAPVDGYGENTLVWQINGMADWDSWPRPAADTAYTVTVRNVIVSGAAKDYTYTVTVFDPAR